MNNQFIVELIVYDVIVNDVMFKLFLKKIYIKWLNEICFIQMFTFMRYGVIEISILT